MNIRWQTYRALELIADSVPQPQPDKLAFVAVWRALASRFTQQLDCEHQIEHLERCLALDWTKFRDTSKPSIWLTLEAFLRQLMVDSNLATSEPEIQQVSAQGGRTWWYACDPRTGQTTYLESEADVQIRLEERHYLF